MDEIKLQLLSPAAWTDYELIDSGNFEKLERFGKYYIARPEPQALWNPSLSPDEWKTRADAYFYRQKGNSRAEERGEWVLKKGMPEQWHIRYRYKTLDLKMRLGLTAFKHVGVFPEQAENWNFIYDQVQRIGAYGGTHAAPSGGQAVSAHDKGDSHTTLPTGTNKSTDSLQVLNLFAYTGGASLAACGAGAKVTHLDSVKPVVGWARENMELSGLQDIRWIVDDALKFARREVKRGNTYQGIILDPPAYGRGPDGERWILEDNLNELLTLCGQLLAPKKSFLILNLYSMGLSAMLARTVVRQLVGDCSGEQAGELYFTDTYKKSLPLGVYYRMWRE